MRFAQLDPRYAQLLKPRGERGEQGNGVGILDALRLDVGRKANADTVDADLGADRFDHLA